MGQIQNIEGVYEAGYKYIMINLKAIYVVAW